MSWRGTKRKRKRRASMGRPFSPFSLSYPLHLCHKGFLLFSPFSLSSPLFATRAFYSCLTICSHKGLLLVSRCTKAMKAFYSFLAVLKDNVNQLINDIDHYVSQDYTCIRKLIVSSCQSLSSPPVYPAVASKTMLRKCLWLSAHPLPLLAFSLSCATPDVTCLLSSAHLSRYGRQCVLRMTRSASVQLRATRQCPRTTSAMSCPLGVSHAPARFDEEGPGSDLFSGVATG